MSPVLRWRVVALLGVYGTLLAAALAPNSLLAQQLFLFLALFVLIIPLHELGHAIAGAAVGYRVMGIVVGTGPSLASFRVLGVHVRINLLPLGGLTSALPRKTYSSMRLRHWILTAGGPLANVFIYFGLRAVFGAASLNDSDHHPLLATAVTVNWIVLGSNLIPWNSAQGPSSDGYQLFTIPFWSVERIEAGSLLLRGSLLHRERQHAAALAVWREGLAKAGSDAKLTAILKNNVAFAALFVGNADELSEANRLSLEAIAVFPELPAVLGTRGAVLLRLGRAAEALPLLMASDTGAFDPRNHAYSHALIASALAALGRRVEAEHRLAEARRADPECDLIPRAEADVAAGPVVAVAPTPQGPSTDPVRQAAAFRRWQREARVVSFVSVLFVVERLALDPIPFVLLIGLAFVPELSAAFALAGYGLTAGLLHALGLARSTSPTDNRLVTAAVAFAMGAAACWLIARHRQVGLPQRSRVPAVLGWIMASLTFLVVVAGLGALAFDRSPLALHGSGRSLIKLTPALIGLAIFLASRRRRGVRVLAAVPVAVSLLGIVPGSSWYLNNVALAGIPVDGAPLVWSDPVPAKVVRTVHFSGPGNDLTVSPSGRAFVLRTSGRPQAGSAGETPRQVLRVVDVDGRIVEIPGTAAAFIDDDRLLVLRPVADPPRCELAEVRPSQGPDALWTKDLGGVRIHDAAISFDRAGSMVLIRGGSGNGAPVSARTTLDPSTPIVTNPLRHLKDDDAVAVALPSQGWGGVLVQRKAGPGQDLVWRTTDGERRFASDWTFGPDCASPLPGDTLIWCFTPRVPLLLRINMTDARVTRFPDEVHSRANAKMLEPGLMAILVGNEIDLLDLNTGRAKRMSLPEDNSGVRSLADGGLATLTRGWRINDSQIVVYAPGVK